MLDFRTFATIVVCFAHFASWNKELCLLAAKDLRIARANCNRSRRTRSAFHDADTTRYQGDRDSAGLAI